MEIIDDFPPPTRTAPPPRPKPRGDTAPRPTAGREQPNNLQAEAGLLSCFLIDAETFERSCEKGLVPEAFYSPAHRMVFEAMLELQAHGELPSPITIGEVMRTRGDLEAVGGVAFLEALANYIETTAHAGHFLKIVQDKYALRQALRRAVSFVEQVYDFDTMTGDLHGLLDKIGAGDLNGRQLDFPGRKPSSFQIPRDDDPSILLGTNRYVCRGDGGLLVSTSGVGKSSWSIQAAYHWCLGRPFLGIACPRPLRILVVQSEDADGDIAECCESCRRMMKLTEAESALVDQRLCILRDKVNRGDAFVRVLGDYARQWKPDLIMLNPLHAYAGCDISDAAEMGHFLREGLNRINEDDKFAYLIIHHTPKPPVKVENQKERAWNEVMYEAAGSAELVNWARFIITIKARAEEGKFLCVLAKRGKRAGVALEVVTEYGRKVEYGVTTIPIRHCTETFTIDGHKQPVHAIYWLPTEEAVATTAADAAPDEGDAAPKKTRRGPNDHWSRENILKFFPVGEDNAIPLPQLSRNVCENFGTPRSTWHRIRSELLEEKRIYQTDDGKWFRP